MVLQIPSWMILTPFCLDRPNDCHDQVLTLNESLDTRKLVMATSAGADILQVSWTARATDALNTHSSQEEYV